MAPPGGVKFALVEPALDQPIKVHLNEKATKIDKIFIVNLTVCKNRQIDGEDSSNFCGLLRKHEL